MFRIESLLSARLFLSPQLHGQRIYFISNLSGHLSLYVMDYGGSVPEPLLPPNIALQNPDLVGGRSFQVFPKLGKILVMLDRDGDENYQPMLIPMEGGFPEPAFGDALDNTRVHMAMVDEENSIIYLEVESRESPAQVSYRAHVDSGKLVRLAESIYGAYPGASTQDHRRVVVIDGYTVGDSAGFLWEESTGEKELLYGVPLEERTPGQEVPLTGINAMEFSEDGCGLLVVCAIYQDTYGPAYFDLDNPQVGFQEVRMEGIVHQGAGEMEYLTHLKENRYRVTFNIDGCSWSYEAEFDRPSLTLRLLRPLVGHTAPLTGGKLEHMDYDKAGDRFILSFSTATSPTQIYTIEGAGRDQVKLHTRERVLGIAPELLSPGEDASYVSHDGTRVSARLYLPAESLGFTGKRPVVFYIHGGPQSQERPDFAWFSMPLIQFLTLNGFAVFVPNVRGSTGYGLSYTKQVDRDWGGQDRFDHVHAFQHLSQNPRLDTSRAAVVGRSYGGYMTLTLAARHPDLWSAACDMFGPFDLLTFSERIPETWKPYFKIALGDPVEDREFLVERSPRTHIDNVSCPMLVIQGKNDPRVVESESRDLVEYLRGQGKEVEYLMFENEGHDVLKYENRVRCYTAITDFFKKYLRP